jgi:hypothetical protein
MKDMHGYCMLWRNILRNRHPDDLSSQDYKAFRKHLGSCSDCRTMLAGSEQGIVLLMGEALLPKGSLPGWDEIARKSAAEQALSFSVPIDPQEVSAAVARVASPSTILEKIFDIQEVKTTRILKEKAEQFIEAWPLLSEVVGGRSLSHRKGGSIAT